MGLLEESTMRRNRAQEDSHKGGGIWVPATERGAVATSEGMWGPFIVSFLVPVQSFMEIHCGAVWGLLGLNRVLLSGPYFKVLGPRVLRFQSHISTGQKTVQRDGS